MAAVIHDTVSEVEQIQTCGFERFDYLQVVQPSSEALMVSNGLLSAPAIVSYVLAELACTSLWRVCYMCLCQGCCMAADILLSPVVLLLLCELCSAVATLQG
jgi:hypothetical protein